MNKAIEDIHAKAAEFFEKHKDQELYDYMLSIASKLEDADMMRHQLGYLLMHARATVAAPVRTSHFQQALDRASKFLKKYEEENA